MRAWTWLVAAAAAICGSAPAQANEAPAEATAPQRPNIVWIVVEDMSAHFSCYGETTIRTPNVERLAAEGVKFERAFVTGPICSISRSALITGMYQTSIGAHHHRSGRGKLKIHLPQGVAPVPKLFKDAGYHTSNLTTAATSHVNTRIVTPLATTPPAAHSRRHQRRHGTAPKVVAIDDGSLTRLLALRSRLPTQPAVAERRRLNRLKFQRTHEPISMVDAN